MKYSRREIFQKMGLAGAGLWLPAAESGCIRQRPESRLLPSLTPLPTPFEVPLPILPVLKPVRSESAADFYEVTVRPATARVLPGTDTAIWGYNGTFPGPTIEARAGRRV